MEPTARERLLTTAAALFRQLGYRGTTVRRIASELGIQSASLYHYIGSKEDLLYELSSDALVVLMRETTQALDGVTDPMERVYTLIRTHLTVALDDQEQHAVMLIELRQLSPERHDRVLALRDGYEAFVREVVVDAQARGALRADIPPRYITLALLDLLNWTIFWYRPTGELTPRALADFFAALFIEGARAAAPGSPPAVEGILGLPARQIDLDGPRRESLSR